MNKNRVLRIKHFRKMKYNISLIQNRERFFPVRSFLKISLIAQPIKLYLCCDGYLSGDGDHHF